MATTGTALSPGASTFPGTGVYPGQGLLPIVRCRISTDDTSDATPNWQNVLNADFRSFSTSRGRETELQLHDAGTASAVLDNRDRAYDPNANANITPMNRVWLYEEFSGEVHDLFRGYVEVWDQDWPGWGGSDAEVQFNAADEFKVLALLTLPTTSPPRSNYDDLVGSDQPVGYWQLNEDPSTFIQAPTDTEPNPAPDPRSLGPWARGRVLGWWTE